MLRSSIPLFIVILILMSACNSSIEPKQLYGEWRYVKVETPTAPEENLNEAELSMEGASITFTTGDSLIIWWGGKKLSHGKFRMEGNLIRYKEDLGGGQTREFPFRVNSLKGSELVFQTMQQQGTIVTAIRQ
jgi:hypothetical protein